MGNHVFICYAHEDWDFVHQLVEKLEAQQIPTWLDRQDIQHGMNWNQTRDMALYEASSCLIILSPAAVISREVRAEWVTALEENKHIIPLLYKECQIPASLRPIQRFDFTDRRSLANEKLLDSLFEILGRPQSSADAKPKVEELSNSVRNVSWFFAIFLSFLLVIWLLWSSKVVVPLPSGKLDTEGMVQVPAGKFFMGCNEQVDAECRANEKPGRMVNLPSFWIDKLEVTVAEYQHCVQAGGCSEEDIPTYPICNWDKKDREQHPMNCVDWNQANTFCKWKGKRLPTEAEWEKAARGTEGQKYPWGNSGYKEAGMVANIADETLGREQSKSPLTIVEGYDDGFAGTAPVGSFPTGASPYGLLDMVGNVWEWTMDWYDQEKKQRVVRGAAWYDRPQVARVSSRDGDEPSFHGGAIGFRCAE